MRSTFDRFAGGTALVTAAAGFLYSAIFIYRVRGNAPSWTLGAIAVLLLLGALAASAALVALYLHLREVDQGFALWALALGLIGVTGSAVHGGFDLALFAGPVTPEDPLALPANPIDPRGLLTFGVAGLSLLVVAVLLVRSARFPTGLGYLGYLSGALLVIIYLGRLLIFDPNRPLLGAVAALEGLIVNPVWYAWLGITLREIPRRVVQVEP